MIDAAQPLICLFSIACSTAPRNSGRLAALHLPGNCRRLDQREQSVDSPSASWFGRHHFISYPRGDGLPDFPPCELDYEPHRTQDDCRLRLTLERVVSRSVLARRSVRLPGQDCIVGRNAARRGVLCCARISWRLRDGFKRPLSGARLHPCRFAGRIPRSWIRVIHAFGRYWFLACRSFIGGIFGYSHHGNSGEDWIGLLNAGAFGLLACFLLRTTGNLWMPIGLHAAFDWGETYFYGVADSGQTLPGHLLNSSSSGPAWLSGGTVGPNGSVLCTLLIVMVWLICAGWLREGPIPRS